MRDFARYTDIELVAALKDASVEAFDELYNRYWEKLFNYTYHRIHLRDIAFEIVQDIFVSIWSRREVIQLESSFSGYLFSAVRFQIINYIRNSRQKESYLRDYKRFISSTVDNSNEESMDMHDLQESLVRSIEALPSRCREITRLSILQNWPTEKISSKLEISRRTVENQLALARKHLKSSLGDYVLLLLIVSRLP